VCKGRNHGVGWEESLCFDVAERRSKHPCVDSAVDEFRQRYN
jgi:hypothetical protein